jgi:hypothetical protein
MPYSILSVDTYYIIKDLGSINHQSTEKILLSVFFILAVLVRKCSGNFPDTAEFGEKEICMVAICLSCGRWVTSNMAGILGISSYQL